MTMKESTICSLIQSFPVLLILAQNHQRCLKTPLVYKPPSPTHSPEYYEALDALIQNLYGHGYGGTHGHGYGGTHGHEYGGTHGHEYGGPHGNSYGGNHGHTQYYIPSYPETSLSNCQYSYGYGKKWPSSHGGHGSKPCYQYVYTTGNTFPTYGSGVHGYPSYGSFGLKKGNIYALNMTTTGYAPNQVYNTKNRYQVVVKKTRIGGRKKKNGKIQGGFFPQRENRNNGFFQQIANRPRNVMNGVAGFFNPRQNRPVVNPNQENIYIIEVEEGTNPNYYNNGQNNFGRPVRPVAFPTETPVYNGNNQFNNGNDQYYPTGNGNNQFNNGNNQFNNGNDQFNPTGNGNDQFNSNGNDQSQPSTEVIENGENYNNQPTATQEDYQNANSQDNTVKTEENDPVNFDDVPSAPQETTLAALTPVTTLPTLTPVPSDAATPKTVSRNNFAFEMPNQGIFEQTCETIDGGVGSCISVYNCQQYLSIIQESQTNPAAVQLLRRAHCGFEGTAPKVCCPRPGIPTIPPVPTTTTTTTTTTTPAPTPVPTSASVQEPKVAAEDFVDALPEPPICGFSNASFTRIVGGVNAKLGAFPWMTLLGYLSARTGSTQWLCGGSLLTSRHVLTAAHCIFGHETDLYVIRLGELDLAREDEGATPVDILIKHKIKHEKYNPTSYTNDIGMLVLQQDAPFTNLIRPICIPRDSELRARSFENYNPMIAGWGHTEFRGPSATHLQVLQLPVVSNDYCSTAYRAFKAHKIDNRVLCAGFNKGGKDACQGDSGGPLMQPIFNQNTYKTFFYQIGVVSFGKQCAAAGFPGVYTRVTEFVPWIEEKVLGRVTS